MSQSKCILKNKILKFCLEPKLLVKLFPYRGYHQKISKKKLLPPIPLKNLLPRIFGEKTSTEKIDRSLVSQRQASSGENLT